MDVADTGNMEFEFSAGLLQVVSKPRPLKKDKDHAARPARPDFFVCVRHFHACRLVLVNRYLASVKLLDVYIYPVGCRDLYC